MAKQKQIESYAPSRHSKVTRFMAAFTASLFLVSSQLALPAQANNLAQFNRGDMSRQEWRQIRMENRAIHGGAPTALPTNTVPSIQTTAGDNLTFTGATLQAISANDIVGSGQPQTINLSTTDPGGNLTVLAGFTTPGTVNSTQSTSGGSVANATVGGVINFPNNVTISTANVNAPGATVSVTANGSQVQQSINSAVNLSVVSAKGAHGRHGNAGLRREQRVQTRAAVNANNTPKLHGANPAADRSVRRADNLSRFVTQENAGAIVRLDNGANLDLTTSTANITLGDKLFAKGGFVTIEVGGEKKNVYAGSKVTAAEYIAVKQVLNGNKQNLVVNANGIATGGTVDLGQIAATKNTMSAESLTVASGVTAIGDLDKHSSFKLTGDLNNFGSIYAVNTGNTKHSADINADNINNNAGALISSAAGTQYGNQQSAIDLSVRANQNLNNAGTIESSGDLSLSAGNSIHNSGSASAAHNVNLNSGNIQNSGTVASAAGNITVDAPATLNVDNNGGTLQALEGAINVRSAGYAGAFDTTVAGGDLLSKELNLQSGAGLTTIDVNKLTGTVNGSGTAAHVSANTDNLVIGSTCLTGDPVYKNAAGDITITGDISVGQALAIFASGNVTTTSGCDLIEARTGGGVGQNIVIGAGFQMVGGGGSGTDNTGGIPPATSTTSNLTVVNGGVTAGGNIDFTASTGLVIAANGTTGAAGNVSLYARGNSANTLGHVLLGTDSTIDTTAGVGSGANNGSITVYAGQNSATTTIQLGALVAANPGTGGGGDITVRNAQPSAGGGVTFDVNGNITAGSFTAGTTLLNPGIQIGNGSPANVISSGQIIINGGGLGTSVDLSSGALATRGGAITVSSIGEGTTSVSAADILTSGGNVNFTAGGSVNITSANGIDTIPATIGNGGNVVIKADTNSNNVGAVNASGVDIDTSSVGSGSAGSVAIDVNLGVGAGQSVSVGNITTISSTAGGDVTIRSGAALTVGTITSTAGGDVNLQTSANNGNINLGGNIIAGSLTASVDGTGVINTPAAGIDFVVDGYTVTGPVVATGQPVSISTLTAGTTIGVAGGSGTLNISSTELASITASDLTIGNLGSGNITVGGNIDTSGVGAGAYNLAFLGNGTFSTGLFDFTIGSKDLDVTVSSNITVDSINGTTGDVTLLSTGGAITAGIISGQAINMTAAGNINLKGNLTAIDQIDLGAAAIVVPVFNVTLATTGANSNISVTTSNSAVPLVIGTAVQQLQISAPGAGSTVNLNIAGTINVTTTGGFTTDNIILTTTGSGSDIILNGNVTGSNSFNITSNDQIQIGGTVTGSNGLVGTAGGDIFGNGTIVATDLDLTSTGGNIGTSTSARLHGQTTGTVTLSAAGDIFYTDTLNLTLGDVSGGTNNTVDIVAGADISFLANSTYNGGTQVYRATTGAIFLGDNTTFNALNSVSLRSFASIVNANIGDTAQFITPQLNLTSDAGNIGVSSTDRLVISATSLSANAPQGNVWISADNITIGGPTSGALNVFDIQADNGDVTTTAAITADDVVLTSSLGSVFINSSVTGSSNATVQAANNIQGTGQLNGGLVSLTATSGRIGASLLSALNVDADTLTFTAGTDAAILDIDSVTLGDASAGGALRVTAQGTLSTTIGTTIGADFVRLLSLADDVLLDADINGTSSVYLQAGSDIIQSNGTIVTPILVILNGNTSIGQTNNGGFGQAIQVSNPTTDDADITTQETGTVLLLASTGNNLTFDASQATSVTINGAITANDTLDITTSLLNNTFALTGTNVINVQSPTGDLTINGGAGTPGSFTAANGINLVATSGDLIFIGNTNFFGVADLYSNPNPPFGAIVITNGATVTGNLAVNLHTCLLDLQGTGIITGNPLNFLCPTGAGTIANTSGNVDLTALGPINFSGKDLAIIASGNITTTGPLTINLSDNTSGGLGGDLVMIAGYNWTPATGTQLNYTPIVFTLTGTSGGGSINLSSATINTSGDAAAGNVLAVAQNGTVNLGTINASSANGDGGVINVIGQNGVSVGDISTNGLTSDGTVTLAVSNPSITGTVRVGNGILFNGSFANSGPNSIGNMVLGGINAGTTGVVNLVGAGALGDTIVQSGNPLIADILNLSGGLGDISITNGQVNTLNSSLVAGGNGNVIVTNSVALDVNNVSGALQRLRIIGADGVHFLNPFTIYRLQVSSGASGTGDIVFDGAVTTTIDFLVNNFGTGDVNVNAPLRSTNVNLALFTQGGGDVNINGTLTADVGLVNINSSNKIDDNGVITAGSTVTLTAVDLIGVNADITAGGDLSITSNTSSVQIANNVDLLSTGGGITIAGDLGVSTGVTGSTITAKNDVDISSATGNITSAGTIVSNTGDVNLTAATAIDILDDISANFSTGSINVSAGTEVNLFSGDLLAGQDISITGTNINLFSPSTITATNGFAFISASDSLIVGTNVTAGTDVTLNATNTFNFSTSVDITGGSSVSLNSDTQPITGSSGITLNIDGGSLVTTNLTSIEIRSGNVNISANNPSGVVAVANINVSGDGAPNAPTQDGNDAGSITITADDSITAFSLQAYGGGGSGGAGFGQGGGNGGNGGNISVTSTNSFVTIFGTINTSGGGGGGQAFPSGPTGGGGDGGDAGTITVSAAGPITIGGPVLAAGGGGGAGTTVAWTPAFSAGGGSFGGGGGGGDGGPGGGGIFGGGGAGLNSAAGGGGFSGGGSGSNQSGIGGQGGAGPVLGGFPTSFGGNFGESGGDTSNVPTLVGTSGNGNTAGAGGAAGAVTISGGSIDVQNSVGTTFSGSGFTSSTFANLAVYGSTVSLTSTSATTTVAGDIIGTGAVTASTADTLTISGNVTAITGAVNLSSTNNAVNVTGDIAALTGSVTLGANTDLTVGGTIKSFLSTVTLNSNDTISVTGDISALGAISATANGKLTASGDVNSSGSSVTLTSNSDEVDVTGLVFGNTAININGATGVTVGGNVQSASLSVDVHSSAGAVSLSGFVSGNQAVNLSADGTLTVTGLVQSLLSSVDLSSNTDIVSVGSTISANTNITILSGPSFTTAGNVTSTSGDVDITTNVLNNTFVISGNNVAVTSLAGSDLTIDGSAASGGTLTANTGTVDLGPGTVGGVTFIGEQTFNGTTNINTSNNQSVTVSNGAVVTGNDTVNLNTCSLILQGNGVISGNPLNFNCPFGAGTIANSSGDVDLGSLGLLVFNGQSLSILASGNVFANGNTLIDLSSTGGADAGDLTVVAGFDFTPSTGGVQINLPNPTVYTIGAANATGGSIDLSGLTISTFANGGGNGGNVTLIASGGSLNNGDITSGVINSSSDLGTAGRVLIIGQGDINTQGIFAIDAAGGAITIANAQPQTFGTVQIANGELIGPGFFLTGPASSGSITTLNLNTSQTGGTGLVNLRGGLTATDAINVSNTLTGQLNIILGAGSATFPLSDVTQLNVQADGGTVTLTNEAGAVALGSITGTTPNINITAAGAITTNGGAFTAFELTLTGSSITINDAVTAIAFTDLTATTGNVTIASTGSLDGSSSFQTLTAQNAAGDIALFGSLSGANVTLNTNGGDVTQDQNGIITTPNLIVNLNGAGSNANLDNAANNVGTLNGGGVGSIFFDNGAVALSLGTFSATQSLTASSTTSITTLNGITTTGNIVLNTPVLNNTNVISAANVSVISDDSLTIDGSAAAGGTLTATTGTVQLTATAGDVTFIGEQTFNGTTNIDPTASFSVIVSNGAVVTGNDTVNLNTCSLVLNGTGVISGNPLNFNCPLGAGTIANSSGDVDLTGVGLVFNGQSLAIIASGNVIAGTATAINLSNSSGSGGNLLVVAGFDFTPSTGGGQVNNSPVIYTFTGASASGGNIDLTGVNIATNGTVGGDAGNITLVARAGLANAGTVATGNLTANTSGGFGGDILVIAEGGFTVGTISNTGAVNGTITLAAAQPLITGGEIRVQNGEQAGPGQFTFVGPTGAGTIANMVGDVDLTGLNLQFTGLNLAILASGNVLAGTNTSIDLSNGGGAGGTLLVVAGFDFSPNTSNLQTNFDHTTTFTFGAPSTSGGNINFTGLTITTNGTGGNAGDVTLVAKAGATNAGTITSGAINAIGSGGGNGGDVLVIAEGGFTIGSVTNTGTVNGSTTLAAAIPVITGGPITVLDGSQGGSGAFTFTVPTGAGTIANASGDVNISGSLTFVGQNLAILAANDIVAATGTTIDLSNGGGAGGNLTVIAGFDFTPGTGGVQVTDTVNQFTITGANALGGNVDLSAALISTTGLTSAGNVLVVAHGGTSSSGQISLNNIDASSAGTAGNVKLIGNDGVSVLAIDTTGATGGDVDIASAVPTVSGTVKVQNGNLLSGTFVNGALTGGFIGISSIDAGNNINISAATNSGITIGNLSADQDINVVNTGSITIQANLLSDNGAINITANDVVGQATVLTINAGVNITADQAISIINTGTDKKLDFFNIGAGATIATTSVGPKTAGEGDITLRMGPVSTPISNKLPQARFTVTETGGTVNLFGRKPKGSKPVNNLTAIGADMFITNGLGGKNFNFGGGVTVQADPPVAAGTPTYVNGRLVGGERGANGHAQATNAIEEMTAALNSNLVSGNNLGQVQTDGNLLSSTVTGTDTLATGSSLIATTLTAGTAGTSTPRTETLVGAVSQAFDGEDNSYMVGALNGPTREAEASICSDADLGTAGNAAHIAHNDRVVVKQGNVLFVPFRNTVVETPQGNVLIEAKSVALVSVSNDKLAVYDLEDSHKGAVSIEAQGQTVILAPGNHLTIASAKSGEFAQVNAIEAIPHRNVATKVTKNGVKLHTSEFSVVSAIQSIKPLHAVMNSKHPQAKKVADRMMKTTAVLLTLGGKGEFQHFFKPAVTAMK